LCDRLELKKSILSLSIPWRVITSAILRRVLLFETKLFWEPKNKEKITTQESGVMAHLPLPYSVWVGGTEPGQMVTGKGRVSPRSAEKSGQCWDWWLYSRDWEVQAYTLVWSSWAEPRTLSLGPANFYFLSFLHSAG
jgi:hypothetical protein